MIPKNLFRNRISHASRMSDSCFGHSSRRPRFSGRDRTKPVFCDDWKEFADGSQRITAVFCDDWRDHDYESYLHSLSYSQKPPEHIPLWSYQTFESRFGFPTIGNGISNYISPSSFTECTPPKRTCAENRYMTRPDSTSSGSADSQQRSYWSPVADWSSPSSIGTHQEFSEDPITVTTPGNEAESPMRAPTSHDQSTVELHFSALPGLNMAVNMATVTKVERDLFLDLAPEKLKDPGALMDLVLKERVEMMTNVIPDSRWTGDQCSGTRNSVGWDEDLDVAQEMNFERDFELFVAC